MWATKPGSPGNPGSPRPRERAHDARALARAAHAVPSRHGASALWKTPPAYSSPAKLGDFSLRLPKHPKLPDLRHCASFPPAFKARTAWERWALDVLSDSCESSISHFLETLGDFSLHRLGFQSVPPALSPGTLLDPMGGLRTNLSRH